MKNIKYLIAALIGAPSALVGIWLRLKARDLAWPANYSFSGPREDTSWAIQERAYQEIGLMLAVFGLLVLLIVFAYWLKKD